jgi:hypothetical protein
MEPRAYGRERREYTFVGRSAARPEIVYETLADLQSHIEWAGRRQWKMFRLLSLSAPPGPARVGTEFESVGTIPMMRTRWLNRNTVTKADRPSVFELTTEGRIPWPRRPHGEGTFVSRFEIEPDGSGSRVTYRMRQLRFREPPWGLRYPILRSITARVWFPIWMRRGFRNLLRLAGARARELQATRTSPTNDPVPSGGTGI